MYLFTMIIVSFEITLIKLSLSLSLSLCIIQLLFVKASCIVPRNRVRVCVHVRVTLFPLYCLTLIVIGDNSVNIGKTLYNN